MNELYSHRSKVKLLWKKKKTGKGMASYSSTRWWSKMGGYGTNIQVLWKH